MLAKMKKTSLTVFLCGFMFFAQAQQNNARDTIDHNKKMQHVLIAPNFPGGNMGLYRYFERHGLIISTDSTDNQTAIVSFLVDKQGNVTEVAVRNEDKIAERLTTKAKNIISRMAKWNPAVENGVSVVYRNTIFLRNSK